MKTTELNDHEKNRLAKIQQSTIDQNNQTTDTASGLSLIKVGYIGQAVRISTGEIVNITEWGLFFGLHSAICNDGNTYLRTDLYIKEENFLTDFDCDIVRDIIIDITNAQHVDISNSNAQWTIDVNAMYKWQWLNTAQLAILWERLNTQK